MNRYAFPRPASRRRAAAFLLLLSGPSLARAAVAPQGPPPVPVRVDAVREEVVAEKRRVTGDLRPVRSAAVASEEAGIVVELLVREGSEVAQGDVLARLDSTRLELELSVLGSQKLVAHALLSERERDVEQQQRDLETLILLAEKDAANPKELADARTAVATAEARLEWARQDILVIDARRKLLEERFGDMRISAPFAGVVTTLHTELGEWLSAGDPALELISSNDLEAWLAVPQRDFAALRARPGPLRIEVDANGAVLDVESYRSIAEIDRAARTFMVVAPLSGNPSLAPGMSVTAEVPTAASAPHLTVAHDALLRNDVGPYVYVAVPGAKGAPHQALPVPVEVLFRIGDRAVVRAPQLAAGALAIVEGNERLYPTAAVQPLQTGAPPHASERAKEEGGSESRQTPAADGGARR